MKDKILVEELLNHDPMILFDMLPAKPTIVFHDGELLTTRRQTVVSRFFWKINIVCKIPVSINHHLAKVLGGKLYNSSTHGKLIEVISKDVYRLRSNDIEDINKLTSKLGFDVSCEMTNCLMGRISSDFIGLDILDAIAITRHPVVMDIKSKVKEGEMSVDEFYKRLNIFIETEEELKENQLAIAYRSGIVNKTQVMQGVGFRGIPTEANGKLFDIPVYEGYVEGINTLYGFSSDSRSAPKALSSNEKPLQDSSYLDRRLQFLASIVTKIEGNDCGGSFADFLISPSIVDEFGFLISKGGIGSMVGKFIYNEETGGLKELDGTETSLNGTYVKLRTPLKCKNPNPHTVCRTCFGGLWRNYYDHGNLGHLSVATFTMKTIQNTMGQKHLVNSGDGAPIKLTNTGIKYFVLKKNKSNFYLLPKLKNFDFELTFNRNEAFNLSQLSKLENLEDLFLNDSTKITTVRTKTVIKGITEHDVVKIDQSGRTGFLTKEFLLYVKTSGWEADEGNNFRIKMKDWDYDLPIMAIPQMEVSFAQHGAEVGRMIESNMNQIDERQKPEAPMSTLQELSSLVNSKFEVPLSCLEVIVYASMIPSRNNHAMARNWEGSVLGVARNIIYSRSLAPAYAFQGHVGFMLDPKSFFPHHRPDSVMDVYFTPEEVLKEFEKTNC